MTDKDWDMLGKKAEDDRSKLLCVHDDIMLCAFMPSTAEPVPMSLVPARLMYPSISHMAQVIPHWPVVCLLACFRICESAAHGVLTCAAATAPHALTASSSVCFSDALTSPTSSPSRPA